MSQRSPHAKTTLAEESAPSHSAPAHAAPLLAAGEAEALHKVTSTVIECQAAGQRIRRSLPRGGRLHLDRALPFLCMYRQPVGTPDPGTGEFVTGEATYLVTSRDPALRRANKELVRTIAETLSKEFGAFLLVEVWAGDPPTEGKPAFLLVDDGTEVVRETLDALSAGLARQTVGGQQVTVEARVASKSLERRPRPLLDAKERKAIGCFLLGVEITPSFRDNAEGGLYPGLLRAQRVAFGRGLRQAFFHFIREHTSHPAKSVLSLGRNALVKAVWSADAQLASLGQRFDLLVALNPVNAQSAFRTFHSSGFQKAPRLRYRPLGMDPSLAKRLLFQIPIERIEDPTVAALFIEKQLELDAQLNLLIHRGTRNALHISQVLYGPCPDALVREAEEILEQCSATRGEGHGSTVGAPEFYQAATRELEFYRGQAADFGATVKLSAELSSGLTVSRGHLLVPDQYRVAESRVNPLLQHEIGTHVLTHYNGSKQRLKQLQGGLAGYDELQEGLAVLAEYLTGGLSAGRLRTLAGRVIAVRALISGATFVDVFRLLCRYGFTRRSAFSVTLRVFRGGGFTKDMVYLRGLVSVLSYVKDGGTLPNLFVGKIGFTHISIMAELMSRKVVVPPLLLPRYLDQPDVQLRLAGLREGVMVRDLVE